MKLYLVQHGEAKPESEDPQRSLTQRGMEEVRNVSRIAKKLNLQPTVIHHSGKRRAEQTAQIFADSLGKPTAAAGGLNPNDEVKEWVDRIFREKEDLMIVGHLPFLEKVASLLVAGDENIRPVLFRFGAVVCLERKETGGWAVRWVLTPEMAG